MLLGALPALAWAFPVVALLYFRVWPFVVHREPTSWNICAPFGTVLVPMTPVVGIVYERALLTPASLGLFALALLVEIGLFAWGIDERRSEAATHTDTSERITP